MSDDRLVVETFFSKGRGFSRRAASKALNFALGINTRRVCVHDAEEEERLFELIFEAVRGQNQVETSLYSNRVYNFFPSVKLPFAGKIDVVPAKRLKLISALRDCAMVYEAEDCRNGLAGNFTNERSAHKAWEDVRVSSRNLTSDEWFLDVIVPVRNNGLFLISKCLPSLITNEIWAQMRVLIVDDASSDYLTIEILSKLEQSFANIEVIRLRGLPSGSASVPRNVGLDRAKSELVTFLDPDNEVSVGAYDELAKQYFTSSRNLQLVSGYQLKVDRTISINARNVVWGRRLIQDPSSLFRVGQRFPIVSTQSAVISRRFLDESKIRFIEGAVGQDTLFGWEILLKASAVLFCSRPYIVYYAQRTGSITNNVNINYFRRALVRERAQAKLFKQAGLLETYRSRQLDLVMEEIYKPKLQSLSKEERVLVDRYIREIYSLYAS